MNFRKLLKRARLDQLMEALRERPKLARLAGLEDERHKLKTALARVQVKIAKLNGGSGTG